MAKTQEKYDPTDLDSLPRRNNAPQAKLYKTGRAQAIQAPPRQPASDNADTTINKAQATKIFEEAGLSAGDLKEAIDDGMIANVSRNGNAYEMEESAVQTAANILARQKGKEAEDG